MFLSALLQDGQIPKSISPQDIRDFLVSTYGPADCGRGFYLDSQFTAAAKLAVVGGVRTKITNNAGLTKQVDDLAAVSPALLAGPDIVLVYDPWDEVGGKIMPVYANETFALQVSFKSDTSANNNFLELELDAGGATPPFLQQNQPFVKGIGVQNNFVFNYTLFAGTDFLNNGAELFLTVDGDANIWEMGFTIVRLGIPHR